MVAALPLIMIGNQTAPTSVKLVLSPLAVTVSVYSPVLVIVALALSSTI